MIWLALSITLWTAGGICWAFILADLLLALNSKLAWVGWWFYRVTMAAAEHSREADRLAQIPGPGCTEHPWCPAQHELLPSCQHNRLHELAAQPKYRPDDVLFGMAQRYGPASSLIGAGVVTIQPGDRYAGA